MHGHKNEYGMPREGDKEAGTLTHLSTFACPFGSWEDLALLTTRTSLV